jgi:hypothetical protein
MQLVRTTIARVLGYRNPIARVLTSVDGGPVRRIVDGRRNIYTGFFCSVKADFAQMPWESRKSERTAMMLAEASSRVVSLLAQPHRLELFIKQQKKPLVYFPDLQLKVHPSFVYDLDRGVPFSIAALARSFDETDDDLRTVIVEMKDDRDRRQSTKKYKKKLELVGEIYEMLGIDFRIVQRGEELYPFQLRVAASVISWRRTVVTQFDVWAVQRALRAEPQRASVVVAALGGGPFGWAKLKALHVRRFLEIDLDDLITPSTRVRLLINNSLRVPVRT